MAQSPSDSSPPQADTATRSIRDAVGDGFCLLVSSTEGVRAVPLPERPELVIGRTSEADVIVADSSVSRRHAVLRIHDSMTLEDLGSLNGTRVNGARLVPGERAPVAPGTVVEVGSATIVVQRTSGIADKKLGSGRARVPVSLADATSTVLADESMKRIYALLEVIAPSPLSVLLLGETGVGKEVFAAALHARSARAQGAFLRLNCAALPDSVLEGELFGYERGAFTGATQARAGLFESANGGTVFLDEVGELPATTQAKLLRVVESGEVLRLGARQTTKVDVRFVSATNRDLRYLVASGTFRADLFFRLNGVSVTIPPLRARKGDVAPLALLFLAGIAKRAGKRCLRLTPEAAEALEDYAWPGNVRELKNVIERAAVFCGGAELALRDLRVAAPEVVAVSLAAEPSRIESSPTLQNLVASVAAPASTRLRDHVGTAERARIEAALAQAHGNQKRAAEILGVSRRTLLNKLDAHGIARPRKGNDG